LLGLELGADGSTQTVDASIKLQSQQNGPSKQH